MGDEKSDEQEVVDLTVEDVTRDLALVLKDTLFDFLQGRQIPTDPGVAIAASALTFVLFTFCRNAGMAIEDIEKGLAQATQNARDEVQ